MTTQIEYARPKGTYYTVLSDGKFHTEVEEGTEGAVRREYETSDGKKGVKIERIAQTITGRLTNISIYEGDYGKLLQLTMGDNDLIISLPTQSSFGEDVMKKLPNIDVEKDVKLSPYSFVDENGKTRKGISIVQDGVKVENYYHEKKGDKYVAINGYPDIPADAKSYDSEDWKLFFGQARKFLVSQVQAHALYNAVKPTEGEMPVAGESISPEEVPF
jgi:hypothetical protein